MGRHSSPDQSAFLRSLAGWFLPWALVAAVAIVAVWLGVDALSRGPLQTSPPGPGSGPAAGAEPTPTKARSSGTAGRPAREPSPTPKPTHTPKPEPTRSPTPELVTEGVTVQVLNGTDSPGADEAMAARLGDLGFEIVAIGSAARPYRDTIVFWSSPGSRKAAEALATRFGWIAEPKPANLSPTVAVHVVVGADAI